MLVTVEDSNFSKEVLEYEGVVFVDFYADWCGPCRMLLPIINEVSEEMPGVKFTMINVDESPDVARVFEVRNLPTLLVFNAGEMVNRHVGSLTKIEIKHFVTV
ncbi:MAG: thioredoxin [Holosporales bacterium]|jgi:thioredoxin 1|nr:thioredoxin [Holosporales bacterium]